MLDQPTLRGRQHLRGAKAAVEEERHSAETTHEIIFSGWNRSENSRLGRESTRVALNTT